MVYGKSTINIDLIPSDSDSSHSTTPQPSADPNVDLVEDLDRKEILSFTTRKNNDSQVNSTDLYSFFIYCLYLGLVQNLVVARCFWCHIPYPRAESLSLLYLFSWWSSQNLILTSFLLLYRADGFMLKN